MEKSAILHIPLSQYAYGTDEEHITIRLRAKAGDLGGVTLWYGDRSCRLTPVTFTGALMERVMTTRLYDYFEARLERPYKRLCYYFELTGVSETDRILYYGDQFCEEPVDDRSEYFQLPFNHRADIVRPPEWAQDAVIYNIFPDSFASGRETISCRALERAFGGRISRGKLGGTIRGITENAGYLQELGVNAIYINPIFAAGEYHKYDLLDYYHIDPCFGDEEDFRNLVETMHGRGIRVVIDGVFNHCGWRFYAFEDVVRRGEDSRYRDWFYGLKFPVVRPEDPEAYPDYECFGYERMMPKLNLANPEAADYFCEVGRYWVREFGIDGWRLDVASEINDGFWRRFCAGVREENSEAILIGEVWESAGHWLDGSMFDSAMNYDFRKHCRRFFAERTIDAAEFHHRVADMLMRYREQTVRAQLNILDSHDVSRFLSLCGEDEARYELAVLFQMTMPGIPSVFYGDECGITGLLEEDYRQPMRWGTRGGLHDFFREAIALRNAHAALRRGRFRCLSAEETSGLYAYERYLQDACIRVILNAGGKAPCGELGAGGEVLMRRGYADGFLEENGFAVLRME